MVWLGIDLGDARVGLALSDPELTLAHPIGNIQVYGDSFRALDEVIDVIGDESVDHVVIGLPLLLNGEEGKSAKKARRWSVNLEKRLHAAVEDESYSVTTVTAHHQLFDARIGGLKHRPMVDQQSAVVILQTALDRSRE